MHWVAAPIALPSSVLITDPLPHDTFMQSGFDSSLSASVTGTPVAVPMPSSAAVRVRDSLSQEIFDNSLQFPDMSVSERNIVYRKQAPMLQGMNLTRVPTGGFPSSPASVIIGANSDGVEYNTRMPALFTQPSDMNKRVTVAPDRPLTGENGGEVVFRDAADSAVRQRRGSMTVRRAEQEAAIARTKQQAAYARMIDSSQTQTASPLTPFTTTSAPASAPAPVLAQAQPVLFESASGVSDLTPTRSSSSMNFPPTAVLAEISSSSYAPAASEETPKRVINNLWHMLQHSGSSLHTNTRQLVTGKIPPAVYFQRFVKEQHWIFMTIVFMALLMLCILIVVIVMAARPTPSKSNSEN